MRIRNTLTDDGYAKLELFWATAGFEGLYKKFRQGTLDKALEKVRRPDDIEALFKIRGFQYGNWLSHEDRFNYLQATAVCLMDLNKVLKFKNNNLGLDGTLGIAFGARGSSSASAHFEPAVNVINLTRYKAARGQFKDTPKDVRFIYTGGPGAFAHEYGHFLDYFFGAKAEIHSKIYALTNGRDTNHKRINYDAKKYPMRSIVEQIIEKACFNGSAPSRYIKRMRSRAKSDSFYEYLIRRNEIFARLFEQYIAYKLKQLKIQNSFLTDTKYSTYYYLQAKELEQITPLFDKLIKQMRTYF